MAPLAPAEVHPAAPGRRELLLVAALTLAALILRLPALGTSSLWLDEMWSVGTARLPWRTLLAYVLHRDSNASVYYVLLHPWLGLGEGEATVRLLSTLLGVATIPAVWALARRVAGPTSGLAAAALLAVNAFHVQFSQEARGYTLVVLLATLSTLAFLRAVEAPAWRNVAAYVVASVLAVHAHVFAVLVLAAHAAALAALPRRAVPWRRLLGAAGAIAVLLAPLAVLIRARMGEPMPPLAWVPAPTVRRAAGLFWLLSGNTNFGATPTTPETLRGAPLALAWLALAGIATLAAGYALVRRGRSPATFPAAVVIAWVTVPVGLAFAASFVKPMFVTKYLLPCLPAFAILAGAGVAALGRRPRVAAAALAATLALGATALPRYWAARATNVEWRAAAAHVLARAAPGDAVVFCVAPGRLLLDYYRRQVAPGTAPLDVLYPAGSGAAEDPDSLAYLPPVADGSIEAAALRHPRVWVVRYHDVFPATSAVVERVEDALALRYRKADAARFKANRDQVTVDLFVRR